MVAADVVSRLRDVPADSHVSWVVDTPEAFIDGAAALLEEGSRAGEKVVMFGPEGSDALAALGRQAGAAVDPLARFLDGGALVPETMYCVFREERARADRERFRGLRVIADMDWLLPSAATLEEIIAFEMDLDRVITEVGATVVCAYRSSSFDRLSVDGVSAVHPTVIGDSDRPRFRLTAESDRRWRLTGEVDFAEVAAFERVLGALAFPPASVVDIGDLAFIDVAGLRAVARSARGALTLGRASPSFRRFWRLGGFEADAPHVRLDGTNSSVIVEDLV